MFDTGGYLYSLSQLVFYQLRIVCNDELFDQFAAMNGRSIPKDQQGCLQVAQEHLEKLDDLWTLDRAGMDLEIEVPKRHSCDDRKTLPAESLLDHRSLAARRPGAHALWPRAQTTFVEKDDGSPFPRCFFLSCGHTERFQCVIFGSSRSRARRVGR